jgi:hypothetical protein
MRSQIVVIFYLVATLFLVGCDDALTIVYKPSPIIRKEEYLVDYEGKGIVYILTVQEITTTGYRHNKRISVTKQEYDQSPIMSLYTQRSSITK